MLEENFITEQRYEFSSVVFLNQLHAQGWVGITADRVKVISVDV